MPKIEYGFYESLARKIIFIDGITRCGKSTFSGIIPSLKDAEILSFVPTLEQIVPAMAFGSIEPEYARSLMNLFFNELAYNAQLSRYVNFRPKDQSGVANYKDPKVYEDRLHREDGDGIVESIRTSRHYLVYQAHDMLVNLDHFNKLQLNYWMISLWRHPVDNIHSWWKKGYGTRHEDDPRCFTLTVQYQGKNFPWYAAGREKECLKLNPMELCVFFATDLIERSVEQYKQNPQSHSRIHILTFEDFCQETDREIDKICEFLQTERTEHTEAFMKKANCPRILDPKDRERKLMDFEQDISKEFFSRLLQVSEAYENNLYGLKECAVGSKRH